MIMITPQVGRDRLDVRGHGRGRERLAERRRGPARRHISMIIIVSSSSSSSSSRATRPREKTGREAGREAGREGGKEAGRRGGRETGRQASMQAGRETPKINIDNQRSRNPQAQLEPQITSLEQSDRLTRLIRK